MARPKSEEEKPLTDTELQIMNILWSLGGGSVHDVLEQLNSSQNKNYAYTTVSTLLRVLEKKDAVKSEKEGRGHRYYSKIKKQDYQKKATNHLVDNVYEGEAAALIKNLLGHAKLTQEELYEVKKILNRQDDK